MRASQSLYMYICMNASERSSHAHLEAVEKTRAAARAAASCDTLSPHSEEVALPREFDRETLEMVADRFKVLAEPTRLELLNALRDGEKSVTQLVEATRAGQANVSRHLSILYRQGVVERRKEGLFTYYRIADPLLFDLCELVCRSLEVATDARREALATGARA